MVMASIIGEQIYALSHVEQTNKIKPVIETGHIPVYFMIGNALFTHFMFKFMQMVKE